MLNTIYMNILMEGFGMLVFLTLLILLAVGGDRKSKQTQLFVRFVLLSTAVLFSDLVSWVFAGNTAPYALVAVRIAVFICCSTTVLASAAYSDYIIALIAEKVSVPKYISRIIYTLCLSNIVLLVVSQFNDMYYYFDADNIYRTADLFWLYEAFGLIILLILSAAALRHRKSLGTNDTLFALSYGLIIFAGAVLQLIIDAEFELSYIGGVIATIAIYGGIQVRREKLFKDMELKLAESRIDTMLSQIQPHFLYNSLTAIQRLCQTDPKVAEETVVEFTRYLRGNIDALSHKVSIPFEKELEHTRCYLAIEQKRFGEKVKILYKITADDFSLPALTLQPIVENAVRYGITKREEGGTVTISTYEDDAAYVITVSDDGAGFDKSAAERHARKEGIGERSHVGIENVRGRLEAMCSGTLDIESKPGEGTTVVIRIPKANTR